MCDVVPMQAAHIILGRPWQFDKRITFDGYLNKYSFLHNGKKITLAPLTPQQVHEDQVNLQREYDMHATNKRPNSKGQLGEVSKTKLKETKGSSSSIELRKERKNSMLDKAKDVRKALHSNRILLILICKETLLH